MKSTSVRAKSSAPTSAHENRLAREKSPYLLQHAHNPVDWFPWGEEAFAKARRENKPIFLSIGYSTCHWCHVMERESFENSATAAIMNREFVNIKVDREERPDVDRVYMTFVQATSGGGGWPMSVWLTPQLEPFIGGTYFPPNDRHGQPAFNKVLERIATAWKEDRIRIAAQGQKIIAALREASSSAENTGELSGDAIDAAYQQFSRSYDAHEGGFGGAPKFPRPVALNFLFRVYARDAKSAQGRHALEMNLFTLRKMAAGGLHDHVGGGFHRYSVDAFWHVPHFEKMLYDQAQLALAYLDGFQITRDAELESVARDILDYVRRDMTSPDGGFFSAEDADSVSEKGATELAEGAFYVWTKKEIDNALGEAAKIFNFHYGVEAEGNAPPGSDPQGEFRGKNILIVRHSIAETAQQFHEPENAVRTSLERSRAILFRLRAQRPRPRLDDKIITAWNGLMISAFARAALVLDEAIYREAAVNAANFLRANLYDAATSTLRRNFREGKGNVEGFAEDNAFFIQGLLDLFDATFDVNWLQFAEKLQAKQDELFLDEKHGGYFNTTGRDANVLLRMKDDSDSAEPSANSISAKNLLRLARLRDSDLWRERAQETLAAFSSGLTRMPSAMPEMLVALDSSLGAERQVVIAGKSEDSDTRELLREVRRHYLPNTLVLLADGSASHQYLAEKFPEMQAMTTLDGRAAAYVCENFACQSPVTSPNELAKLLSRG